MKDIMDELICYPKDSELSCGCQIMAMRQARENLTPATHADRRARILKTLRAEVADWTGMKSIVPTLRELVDLLEDAILMLNWDESDLYFP